MIQEHSTPKNPETSARARLLSDLPVTERRLRLAGIDTAILEGGSGRSIVLLHGPGEFAGNWMRVIPSLRERYHVVAPDLPAHGASGGSEESVDESHVLSWLRDLIDQTCESPPVLVGQILGGAIAARFAIAHGDRIERLVLVDALGLGPFRPSPRFAFRMMLFLARPNERSYERFMTHCSHDLGQLQSEMGEQWETFSSYNIELARDDRGKARGRMMRELGIPRIPPEKLARIDVPTDLIWGRHDLANRVRVAERASARYGWPLQVIEHCADDPPRDQPGAFVEALERILEERNRREAVG